MEIQENNDANLNIESENIESTKDVNIDWKRPGFHRPLAGILYNIIYIFIAAGFGILISIWLLPNLIYPFPEAMGFENLTMQMFVVYFSILDLGIGGAIQRFVAEENISNPKNAIKYIQFFIWYQMFSGLFQVTTIAFWVLYILPTSELAYAAWFFLIYSVVQYPGMLGIFRGTLEAYQRFDKANIIGFLQYQLFENILRIIFILVGRSLGSANPAIGELMGAAMGSILGKYLKDFVSAILAGIWVHPIIKEIYPEYGIKALFFTQFDKEIVKKCLSFGIKVLIPGLISPIANFVVINLTISYLPNYSTIMGLFMFGEMLGTMAATLNFPGIASTISESYLNDQFELTKHYINQFFKWSSILSWFMIGLLFFGANIIGFIAGENFYLVTPIIQHFLIWKLFSVYASLMDQFNVGCGKPSYNIILIGAEQITRIFVLWLLLVPFPTTWVALVYSLGVGWFVKWIVGMILFYKKVIKFKINIWQTFVAPLVGAMAEALYVMLAFDFLSPLLNSILPELVGSIILLVLGIFTGPFLIFFPVYSLVGGWDDDGLKILENAYELSGPSKPLIKLIKNFSMKIASLSPIHNKFPSNYEGVDDEIKRLIILRNKDNKDKISMEKL